MATLSQFARPSGEKAACAAWHPANPEERPAPQLYAQLSHGDLLYHPGGERAVNTYVIVVESGRPRPLSICDQEGYGLVPRKVSAHIEDPATFYGQGGLVGDAWLSIVEIDTEAHQPLLQLASGGRPVDPSRTVWWSVDDGALYVRSPLSLDIPGGYLDAPLRADTPELYLGPSVETDVDPTMAKKRLLNKELYETKAHPFFLGLQPGAGLFVRSVPKANETSCFGGSEQFQSVWPDPADGRRVLRVYTKSGDHTIEYSSQVVIPSGGPFGGVALWVSRVCERQGIFPYAAMLEVDEE